MDVMEHKTSRLKQNRDFNKIITRDYFFRLKPTSLKIDRYTSLYLPNEQDVTQGQFLSEVQLILNPEFSFF